MHQLQHVHTTQLIKLTCYRTLKTSALVAPHASSIRPMPYLSSYLALSHLQVIPDHKHHLVLLRYIVKIQNSLALLKDTR